MNRPEDRKLTDVPVEIPEGVEIRVTLTDARDPVGVCEVSFEPTFSREAIYREFTVLRPFAAAVASRAAAADVEREGA